MSTYTYYFCDGIDHAMHNWNGEDVLEMDDIPSSDTICNVPEDWYLRKGKSYSGVLAELDKETFNLIKGREKGHPLMRTITFSEIDDEVFEDIMPSYEDKYEWNDEELSDELIDFICSLTDKQKYILFLRSDGLSTKQIGKICNITPQTVVTTLDRIKKKGLKHEISKTYYGLNDSKKNRL